MLASMKYERIWDRLVEHLDEMGSAREVPVGVEVAFRSPDGVARTITLVVSRTDWDNYITIIHADGDPSVTRIRDAIRAMPADTRYLVYDGAYDFAPSTSVTLPADE